MNLAFKNQLRRWAAAVPGVRRARAITRDVYGRVSYLGTGILSEQAGNDILRRAIEEELPLAAAKIGETELRVLRAARACAPIPAQIVQAAYVNAGIFPPNNDGMRCFADIYRAALNKVSLLAVWYNWGESAVVSREAERARLTGIKALEPFYHAQPWSLPLRGRKTLIVSPFVETMQRQEPRLANIWAARPEFTEFGQLHYLKCPLSPALAPPDGSNWIEELRRLEGAMQANDFDVAIIGAGAYSLPLAVHAQRLGKVGVHMGGGTQLLFGILGRRWENSPFVSSVVNEFWVRPSGEEAPSSCRQVENGAYW